MWHGGPYVGGQVEMNGLADRRRWDDIERELEDDRVAVPRYGKSGCRVKP